MRRAPAALIVTAILSSPFAAGAQPLTREEVLASAYPGAAFKAEQVFLTADQRQRAEAAAGSALASSLVARYVVTDRGQVVGRAYVDTHVVRTKKESLLVCLDPSGRVKRIEVTAFLEPQEYRAPAAWTRQFHGRTLDGDTQLNRAIRPIAGATLTATAETAAVRRVLAIDRVLSGADKP